MFEKILFVCLIVYTNGQTNQQSANGQVQGQVQGQGQGQGPFFFDLPPLNLQPLQLRLNPNFQTEDSPALLLIRQNESIPVSTQQSTNAISSPQWPQTAVWPNTKWSMDNRLLQSNTQFTAQPAKQQLLVQQQPQQQQQQQWVQTQAVVRQQQQPQQQQWLQLSGQQPQYIQLVDSQPQLIQLAPQQQQQYYQLTQQPQQLIQLAPQQAQVQFGQAQQWVQLAQPQQQTQQLVQSAQPKETKPLVPLAFQSQPLKPLKQISLQTSSAPKAQTSASAVPTWVSNLQAQAPTQRTAKASGKAQFSQTFANLNQKQSVLTHQRISEPRLIQSAAPQQNVQSLSRSDVPKQSSVNYASNDVSNVNTVIQSLSAYTPNQLPAQTLLFNQLPTQSVVGQQISPKSISDKNTKYFPTVTLPAISLPSNELPARLLDLTQFLQQRSNANAISNQSPPKNPNRSTWSAEAATLTPQTASPPLQPLQMSSFASLQNTPWSNPSPLQTLLSQQQAEGQAQAQVQAQSLALAQQQQQQQQLQQQAKTELSGQLTGQLTGQQQTISSSPQFWTSLQSSQPSLQVSAPLQQQSWSIPSPLQGLPSWSQQSQTLSTPLQSTPAFTSMQNWPSASVQTRNTPTSLKPLSNLSPIQSWTSSAPLRSISGQTSLKHYTPLQSVQAPLKPLTNLNLVPSQLPSPLTLTPLTPPSAQTPQTVFGNNQNLSPLKPISFRSTPFQSVSPIKWSNNLSQKQSFEPNIQTLVPKSQLSLQTQPKFNANPQKVTLASISNKQAFSLGKSNFKQWSTTSQNSNGNGGTAQATSQGSVQIAPQSSIQPFGARLSQTGQKAQLTNYFKKGNQ